MTYHECQLKNEMWRKADTWKVDDVANHANREIAKLGKEVENLRYRIDQLGELRIRKDEEFEALRMELNELRGLVLPSVSVSALLPTNETNEDGK